MEILRFVTHVIVARTLLLEYGQTIKASFAFTTRLKSIAVLPMADALGHLNWIRALVRPG